jgi:hypothetical protein
MTDVTQIVSRFESGDPAAAEPLLPLVDDELRRLDAHRLTQKMPWQTLQATVLVHEANLRPVDEGNARHPLPATLMRTINTVDVTGQNRMMDQDHSATP